MYQPEKMVCLLFLISLFLASGCVNQPAPVPTTPAPTRPDLKQQPIEQAAVAASVRSDTPTPVVDRSITGTVVDKQTGQPVAATITFGDSSQAATQPLSVTTSSDGLFQVTYREPPAQLRVDAPGYEPRTLARQIVLTQPIIISLLPKVTTGTLLATDTGRPLANITMTATSGAATQTVVTGSDGTFQLYALQPGQPLTIAPPPEYWPLRLNVPDREALDIQLNSRMLTVTVRSGFDGQPIAQSRITVAARPPIETNLQGQAVLSRVAPSARLTVTRTGYLSASTTYRPPDSRQTMTITLTPTQLALRVQGEAGQPLPRATLYLGDSYVQADDQGYLLLNSLPQTPTRLMIKAAGYHRTYARLSQTGVVTGGTAPFSGVEGRWLASSHCDSPGPDSPTCLMAQLSPFHARAIYVPLHYMGSSKLMTDYLDFLAGTDHNAIIVDVKGDFGQLAWRSNIELISEIGADAWVKDSWMSLEELVAEAKARHIYTIARIVVFKDDPLAHARPEMAAVTADGVTWIDGEGLGWANPFREEVWDHNIGLAQEVAAAGFDELNFDYIRFPSDGSVEAIVYEEENTRDTRTAAIGQFMARLAKALRPSGVFISADVFGLTLWVEPESDMRIGQRVIDIAPQVDYLAPMVYPSTFIPGNLGYDNPSDEPYGVIYRSQKQAETLAPPGVKVRPWLQGYWYTLAEMEQLKQAALDAGAPGWAWWNAGGKYNDELFVRKIATEP